MKYGNNQQPKPPKLRPTPEQINEKIKRRNMDMLKNPDKYAPAYRPRRKKPSTVSTIKKPKAR